MTSASELVDRFRAAGFNDRQAREIADAMVESRPAAAVVDAPLTKGDIAKLSVDMAKMNGDIRALVGWGKAIVFVLAVFIAPAILFLVQGHFSLAAMISALSERASKVEAGLVIVGAEVAGLAKQLAELLQ